jgi:serralysin
VLGEGAVATSLLGVANLNATGNAVGNVLLGNRGANSLTGLDGNDKLLGGAGADRLQGGDGVDVLTGGAGRDQLTGGAQRDIFDFNTLTESGATSASRDLIRDFSRGLDDIDLSTLDAITGGGNNAFTFIGKSAFSQVAGQLRYVLFNQAGSALDHTIVEGDVNGDARADFQIDLSGLIGFTTTDFIL